MRDRAPSGSGKSTLLRCMAFLDRYDEGRVFIEGHLLGYREADGKRMPESDRNIDVVRSVIGMVFQHYNLWPPQDRARQRHRSIARGQETQPTGRGGDR